MATMNTRSLPSLAPVLERDTPEECPECGSGDIVEAWREGQNVCRSCGLVIQEKLVDLGCEWRTFTNDEPGADPNRASGPTNPLLESGPSTSISVEGRGGLSSSLNRAQNMHTISASDRFLTSVFGRFSKICERESIPRNVQDRCDEMFKQYYDHMTLKPDGSRTRSLREDETTQIIAGVLFLSCRIEGVKRSYPEITAMTGVQKKDIGRIVKLIERNCDIAKVRRVEESIEDFIARFCNKLNLPRTVINAATELSEKARNEDGVYGRTYPAIAAACIFIICQLGSPEEKKTAKHISDAAHVAEVTIRAAYKKIYPHLTNILPEGYQVKEKFAKLPVP